METETFQHYQVLRRDDGSLWELGRGAMGVTYKAFDVNLRCHVALKVVNPQHLESEVSRQRFLREARAAAALRHRHIASVYHLGNDADSFFYSMEFIDGETVEHLVTRLGPLPPADALGIASQVSRALGAAAKQGLVHRDIKPANIMVVREDDDDPLTVKVIDFGLARQAVASDQTAHLTLSGFVGTPQYASPEQIEEQNLDSRSDIYSLGVTLWYMLNGQPPFTGSIFRISSQHLTKEPPWELVEHLPQPVRALLARMLQKDPANRPQNPVKLRLEIEACLRELPDGAPAQPLSRLPITPGDDTGTSLPVSEPTLIVTSGHGSTIHSAAMAGESTQLQGPPPAAGGVLADRYALVERIGEGALGQVFRASDTRQANKEVAVKVLHPALGLSAPEFYHLQGDLGKLRAAPHARLVEPFALEQARGYRFMVVEWVNGFTLVDLLRRRGRLGLVEAMHLLDQASAAAAHCSAYGLHRLELATHQVLIHFPEAFAIDKALAVRAIVEQPLAEWPEFGLKLDAMAPARESLGAPTWNGAVTLAAGPRVPNRDTQSSIRGLLEDNYFYALGALLYEMLSGAPPPPHEAGGREVPPLSLLNEDANHVLRRALSSNPGFAQEREFFDALLAASGLGHTELHREPAPVAEPPVESRADEFNAADTIDRRVPPPPAEEVEEEPLPVASQAAVAAPVATPAVASAPPRPPELEMPVPVLPTPARVAPLPPVRDTAADSLAVTPAVPETVTPVVPVLTTRMIRPAAPVVETTPELPPRVDQPRKSLLLPLVGVGVVGIALVAGALVLRAPKEGTRSSGNSPTPSPAPTVRASVTPASALPTPANSPTNIVPDVAKAATPAASPPAVTMTPPPDPPTPAASVPPDGGSLPEITNFPPAATPAPSPVAASSPAAPPPAASPTPGAKPSASPADSPKKKDTEGRDKSPAGSPPKKETREPDAHAKVPPPPRKDPVADAHPKVEKPRPETPPRSQGKPPSAPAHKNDDDGAAPGFMR